jgi:hypothetical protein
MSILSLARRSTLAVKICVKFSSIIECTFLSIFFLLLFVGHFEKWKGEKAQSSNSILLVSNLISFIVSILFYFGLMNYMN